MQIGNLVLEIQKTKTDQLTDNQIQEILNSPSLELQLLIRKNSRQREGFEFLVKHEYLKTHKEPNIERLSDWLSHDDVQNFDWSPLFPNGWRTGKDVPVKGEVVPDWRNSWKQQDLYGRNTGFPNGMDDAANHAIR